MRVVIVGGGFGGVKLALKLAKKTGFSVTLISDKDHFVYYPEMYAVATGGSRRESIILIDHMLKHTKIKFVQDTISGYDPVRKIIRGNKTYSYDYVIFSIGVITSYFGIEGLDKYSYGIKTLQEIDRFRKHIHDEITSTRKLDKQYVVVGAGPTGIELSASLSSYISHIMNSHGIGKGSIKIKLVEAAPRVAPRMSEKASQILTKRLKRCGVKVMTDEKVEWQDDDELSVNGRSLSTETVIWTSGVSVHPFFSAHSDHFKFAPNRKVLIDQHLMSEPHTYVIGDNAATPYSGLAQTALHDALFVANDLERIVTKRSRPAYKPRLPVTVLPVGVSWALAEWRFVRIWGWPGHLLRRAADLIGYNDILPFKIAFATWRQADVVEGDCLVCQKI